MPASAVPVCRRTGAGVFTVFVLVLAPLTDAPNAPGTRAVSGTLPLDRTGRVG
ncbi:hypothetical protein ACFY9F_34130 [Streptomyces sp. NPDC012421]|uniref:hypothetical protein n=1 Tax=Streptomyces sp. NPDC012421 TaxID=3364832 RepID=UPI0036EA7C33